MKKRIRLKKRKMIKKTNIFLTIIIIMVICVFSFLNFISKRITPVLFEISDAKVKKLSTIVINKAISEVLNAKIDTNDIFTIVVSESGEIQTIDFNSVVVNKILNTSTTIISKNLRLLEQGKLKKIDDYDIDFNYEPAELKKGIIAKIPLGMAFKNSLTSNIGPKIPIRLHYIGDINSNIKTKITEYGINNAMIEIGVNVEITAQIILPFITKKTKIGCTIPLAIKMIQGNIPNYYGNGLLKDSNIYSIPVE